MEIWWAVGRSLIIMCEQHRSQTLSMSEMATYSLCSALLLVKSSQYEGNRMSLLAGTALDRFIINFPHV